MPVFSLRSFLAAALLLLMLPLSAQTTYYVSPSGEDGQTGTSLADAWQTIAHGIATIAPGDTLLVDDGLYVETDLAIRQVSTADRPTVVKSINQWGAKIEGTTQYNTILRTEDARHVIIDGFEVFNNENRPFEDWNQGINIFKSNFVTVTNCYVHDCGCGGVGGRESDYMTITRNVTRDNAKTNPYNCSGISIYQPLQLDDEPGTHILIAENVCFENECRLPFSPAGFTTPTDGNGIILDDFNWTQGDNPNPPFVAETVVENNLSFNNGGAGMKAFEVANAIFRNNTSVHNNHVLEEYGSNIAEIAGQAVDGDMVFHNNLAVQGFGQEGHGMYWEPVGGEATLDVRNNLVVGDLFWRRTPTVISDNLVTNYDEQSYPQFAQILPDDFTFTSVDDFKQYFALREGSPALNAGDNSLAPATDLIGVARPLEGTVDIGAFEGAVAGAGPVASNRVFEGSIPSTAFPVTIDGIKDAVYSATPEQIGRLVSGRVSNDEDLSATWTAAWDETALYLLVEVTDNRLRNDSADPLENDGVEIFIDADNSRGDTYDGVNDLHYILPWNSATVTEVSRGATEGVISAQRSGFTGYSKEIILPWSTLRVTPSADMQFGLDFRVNDDDNDGAIDGRMTWQDRNDEAAISPAVFGSGRLVATAPPPPVYATAGATPITIDGTQEEAWWNASTQNIGNLIDLAVDDEEDLSATWRALWNPTFLYLFVSVTDDELRDNSSDWFNDDGIELYFDMGLERGEEYDNNDRQLSISLNDINVVARQGTLGQGVLGKVVITDAGYDVEIRLPWSVLGFTPEEGKFFGFDVHVIDDDDVSARDGKLAWFATVNESDEKPSLFGMVYLGAEAPVATFNPTVVQPLSVFPNPTNGEVVLDLPVVPESVSVIDMYGREVLRVARTNKLDLAGLPAASYLLSARTKGGVFRSVVVVR